MTASVQVVDPLCPPPSEPHGLKTGPSGPGHEGSSRIEQGQGKGPGPGHQAFFGAGRASAVARVRRRIAKSMLGRAVTVRVSTGETVQGIVIRVLAEAGRTKVVVGESQYDLAQILTVAPPELPPR